jgi:hypothetical protein
MPVNEKLIGALELALTVIWDDGDFLHNDEYIREICGVLRDAGSKHPVITAVLDFSVMERHADIPQELAVKMSKLLDEVNPYSGTRKELPEMLKSYPCR